MHRYDEADIGGSRHGAGAKPAVKRGRQGRHRQVARWLLLVRRALRNRRVGRSAYGDCHPGPHPCEWKSFSRLHQQSVVMHSLPRSLAETGEA